MKHRFFKNDFIEFMADEQAEFIVEACNNYERLLAEIEKLKEEVMTAQALLGGE